MFNSKVANGVNNKEKGVIINLTDAVSGAASKIETDVALISIGRRPFTGGLQLEKAGLKTNERGVLEINKHW